MGINYVSIKKFDVEPILELIRSKEKTAKYKNITFKVSGGRLSNFAYNGVDCICCGAKAAYFSLETQLHSVGDLKSYHLNLYAIDRNGKPVMMTKDHIILRSLGGSDTVENYSPMCLRCNNLRGNSYESQEEFIKEFRKTLNSNDCQQHNFPKSKNGITFININEKNLFKKGIVQEHVITYIKEKYSDLIEN